MPEPSAEMWVKLLLVNSSKEKIESKIGQFWISGENIFARKQVKDMFTVETRFNEQNYVIEILFKNAINLQDMQEGSDSYQTSK